MPAVAAVTPRTASPHSAPGRRALSPRALAAALSAGLALAAPVQAQSNAEVLTELQRLRAEVQDLRQQLQRQSASGTHALGALAAAPGPAPGQTAGPALNPASSAGAASGSAPATTAMTDAPRPSDAVVDSAPLQFFGYGEMQLTAPTRALSQAQATVRRSVLGWSYRFDERTRLAAELEIENAVASAGDQGEVALEQLYVEHDLSERLTAKAGLFLLPVGLLNETHEPTRFFGVQRNAVETDIIPTTWRELGLGLRGHTEAGLRWDLGLTTSFDLTKWDPASDEGRQSPLASIHQEGQLAKARHLAAFAAVNHSGWPGLQVGASVFAGGVGQKSPGYAAPDASVVLGEVHARWQSGRWDLSALAAEGRFRGVDALNATFAGMNSPVPESFGGWYAQVAYRLWQDKGRTLWPFARYEQVQSARSYAGLPAGLVPAATPQRRIWTAGLSWYLHPQVVVKLDAQKHREDANLDQVNVGVGFHF